MSFFSEQSDESAERVRAQSAAFAAAHEANRRRGADDSKRARIGLAFLTAGMLLLVGLGFSPAPYVVRSPGPVFDALGTVQTSQEDTTQIEVVTIDGAESFEPESGELDVMTVSVGGRPEALPNWFEVFIAYLTPASDVLPVEAYYGDTETGEQRDAQNVALMQGSEADAIAAALISEGYEVGTSLAVASVNEGGASAGAIEVGDIVQTIAGEPVASMDELRAALEGGAGDPADLQPVEIVVDRAGETVTVDVTPQMGMVEGVERPLLGVSLGPKHDFPFDVSIELGNVGGPSAGLIFALAVVDKLTEGDLTGGLHVTATGTMSPSGEVGPIGGITQKLHAAKEVGADLFVAPSSNCAEAVAAGIPEGLPVYAVETLSEAETVLQTVSSGGDTSALATCESVAAQPAPAQ